MNTASITAPSMVVSRAATRSAGGRRMTFRARSWALPAMMGSLAAFAVGFPGSWLLTAGATNLAGAILWLSGLVLLAGALESERHRTTALLALSAAGVMLFAALGKTIGTEFYLLSVWILAACAGTAVLDLTRPTSR